MNKNLYNVRTWPIYIYHIVNNFRYCESRRKVLLDHVHEGYDKETWEYQDF